MSHYLFKEFVSLFKSWPVETTKQGRCLGEYIRKVFGESFKRGELSDNIDAKYWNKVLTDLKPIVDNEYARKYPRTNIFGALLLSKDQCKLTLSNQSIRILTSKE